MGCFDVIFLGKTASSYRDGFIFKSASQCSIMCNSLESADDMYTALDENHQYSLLQANPLHSGFILDSISFGRC